MTKIYRGRGYVCLNFVLYVCLSFSLACQRANDRCATAKNGSCEELRGCSLGTDTTDCDEACSGSWTEEIVGACAHDQASWKPARPKVEIGSGGVGGVTGAWDGVLSARGRNQGETLQRHYRVYVPKSYDPQIPMPVFLVLGGFTVEQYTLPEYTELNRTADLGNFIVVYADPDYRNFGGEIGWVYAWYVYQNAWQGGWSSNPDIDFLTKLVGHLKGLYNVDCTRVFISGHSRGAGMAMMATFERPDVFAGFAAQAGFVTVNHYDTRLEEIGSQVKRTGVLLHGIADPDVNVGNSDRASEVLTSLGWVHGVDYLYYRLPEVTHRWQPQHNQDLIDFLFERPAPFDEVEL